MNLAISMCRLATKLHLAGVNSLHGVAGVTERLKVADLIATTLVFVA